MEETADRRWRPRTVCEPSRFEYDFRMPLPIEHYALTGSTRSERSVFKHET